MWIVSNSQGLSSGSANAVTLSLSTRMASQEKNTLTQQKGMIIAVSRLAQFVGQLIA